MNTMMVSFQTQTIKNFIDIIKLFKSDDVIIMCNNGEVFSSNMLFSYMKTTQHDLDVFFSNMHMCCYSTKQLVQYVCSKDLVSIDIDMYGNLYVWITGEGQSICILNNMIPPNGYRVIDMVRYYRQIQPDLQYDSIDNDLEIIQLQSMLTKDGSIMYKKDGYIMTLYKGLLPLNKSDKLALKIYNDKSTEVLERFIANFSVIKKKKVIDLYAMYLYL